MRILVAEDVQLMQKLLKRLLDPFGEVTLVKTGREAFSRFQEAINSKKYFNLVCLDLNLPEINGLEVLKNIRAAEKLNHVPIKERAKVVVVSSTNDADVVMKAINLGCNGYIVKPFSKDKIINELKKLGLISSAPQPQN
ncbi:response regulator [Calditrichota bacterium GD2]